MARTLVAALMLACALSACTNVGNKTTQINVVAPTVAPRPAPSPAPTVTSAGAILPCSEESRALSVSGPQLTVRYMNATAETVSVLWLDPSGKRQGYARIDAGKTVIRPGASTSYWLVADAKEQCIGIVRPGSGTQIILVRKAASGPELVAAQDVAMVIPTGTARRLDKAFSLNEDCSPAIATVLRIATQPAHGAAEIRQGSDYPNYPVANPRSACNKHTAPDVELWYKPASGYAGDDSMSIDYVFPDGRERLTTFLLTVR